MNNGQRINNLSKINYALDEVINHQMFQFFRFERIAPGLPFLPEIPRFEIILV